MSTPSLKQSQIDRKWYLIDAKSDTLGRVAARGAKLLIGKSKPTYTPNIDAGDHVIIINAAEVKTTGKKEAQKLYYRHSGYPGSIKSKSLGELREEDPLRIMTEAIRGMLPKNKLMDGRLKRLHVYAGAEHEHEAQKPVTLEVENGR